jgi:WD40 repeat protein
MAELKINKPEYVCKLTFEGAWPTSVAFLGSHRRVAAGNRNGQLYVWELPDDPATVAVKNEKKKDEAPVGPAPALSLEGHTNGITRLRAHNDGKTLISASLDRSVRIWDTTAAPSGEREAVLDIRQREALAKRTKKDDALKVPGVKVNTLSAAHVLDAHKEWVQGLDLSSDGRRLITGDDNNTSIVWDFAARREIARWQGHAMDGVCSSALSPDGKTAFVAEFSAPRGSFDRPPAQAKLFDATSGELKTDLLAVQFPDVKQRDNSYGYARKWGKFVARGFVCSAFSPDGKLLAIGQGGETGTGKVHLIDTATGKLVRTVSGHQYGVCDVLFSSDGKHVISSGRDTTVRICQVSDGKEIAALSKPRGGQFKDWIHAIALSPDEKWLAAADIAGHVQLWKLEG